MILHYFTKKENIDKQLAEKIYINIIKISKEFINKHNFFISKDFNTSFELVSIFVILHINHLINIKFDQYKSINQHIINAFINDLDESLRTAGIGDMSIGKYVKKYVKKFYYRISKFNNKKEEDIKIIRDYILDLKFINQENSEYASKKIEEAYILLKKRI